MTLKKCPSCGHQHDSADIICPYCKHSYSDKKFVCTNCGAYLQPTDKVCYVCGQVVEQTAPEETAPVVEDKSEVFIPEQPVEELDFSFDEEENLEEVLPQEKATHKDSQPKEKSRKEKNSKKKNADKNEKPKKSKKKGAVISIVAIVIVALVAAGVGLCYYNGWFQNTEEKDVNIKLYFEKPLSTQNLMTSDGTVYNWTGDVDINYTVEGKTYKKPCKMTDEYDNIWYKNIPANAENIYFSEASLEVVRTEEIGDAVDGTLYYISDILFNNDLQLPLNSCLFKDYEKHGADHITVETTTDTQIATEAQTETEQLGTEPTFETEPEPTAETDPYSISVPSQWSEDLTVVENGNCTGYYESYNYSNYQCGTLMLVYVFDADDTSYSEMNVQKVLTTSDGTKKIVVVTPTDIQFNDGDDTAIEKYTNMSQYTSQVVDSVTAN